MLASSIITACVPQFKRLLNLLNSGMLGTDDLRRRGQTGWYGYTGHSGDNNKSQSSSDPHHVAKSNPNTYPFRNIFLRPSRTDSYQNLLDGPRSIGLQTGFGQVKGRGTMDRL
ncbi:MAG: hypothetical protein Q9186_000555 [Xanthomendoza sp. 1 TL-2023]